MTEGLNKSVKSAKCKRCGCEIPKQALRYSNTIHGDRYPTTNHFHLKCYIEMCEDNIKIQKIIIRKIKKEKKALEEEKENFVIEKL